MNKFNVQNSIKKKRLCESIATFYVKISHIFAAIVTTINPSYIYKDENGKLNVEGFAYSGGGRGIFRVDVSTDGG